MLDASQSLLLLIIIVLTVLLLVLGVQAFFILRDFRKTISKANKLLDDTGTIAETFSKPISSFAPIAKILGGIVGLGVILKKFSEGDVDLPTLLEEGTKKKTIQKKISKPVRRFFRGTSKL